MARGRAEPRRDGAAATVPDGVVLAGGPGRRFGGGKAVALLGGRTLVERALDALAARCREVVVVSRPEAPLPRLDVPVHHDRPGPDAPLTALATALGALRGDRVVALACDLPFAAPALDAVIDAPPRAAAVAAADGRRQPLCARYPREEALRAAEAVLSSGEEPSLTALLARLEVVEVEVPGGMLLNVNTREDLARAEDLLADPDG